MQLKFEHIKPMNKLYRFQEKTNKNWEKAYCELQREKKKLNNYHEMFGCELVWIIRQYSIWNIEIH